MKLHRLFCCLALLLAACVQEDGNPAGPEIKTGAASLALGAAVQGSPGTPASYTILGLRLATPSVSITAPPGVQIRVAGGAAFASSATLAVDAQGNVATTAIEARIGAAAPVGPFAGVIRHVAGSAAVNVAVTGSVSAAPSVQASPGSIDLGTAAIGVPGATIGVFTVSGVALSADVVVTPPVHVEIRRTGTVNWGVSPLSLPPVAGALAATDVDARIAPTAPIGHVFGAIDLASAGTPGATVLITGVVTPPPGPTVQGTPSLIDVGSTVTGNPGAVIAAFTVSGSDLTANLTVSPPLHIEIRRQGTMVWQASALAFGPTAGAVAATVVEVRIAGGAPQGHVFGFIDVDSAGAAPVSALVSGSVTAVPVDSWLSPAGLKPATFMMSPLKRYNHGLVWLGTGPSARMVAWGGITESVIIPTINTAVIYNPFTDSFEDPVTFAPNLHAGVGAPGARHNAICVAAGDLLFVLGGADGVNISTFGDGGVYDFSTDTWFTGTGAANFENFRNPSIPDAGNRAGAAACWTGPATNKILIWGGYRASSKFGGGLSDGFIYDIATDSWMAMSTTDAPSARQDMIHGFINGRLFVHSGWDSVGTVQIDGGVYDLASDQWITGSGAANFERFRTGIGSPGFVFRGSAASAAVNGLLLAFGGTFGSAPVSGLTTGWAYDPSTDTFPQRAALNSGTSAPGLRYATRGCTDGQKFYVFGGIEPQPVGPGIYDNGAVYEP